MPSNATALIRVSLAVTLSLLTSSSGAARCAQDAAPVSAPPLAATSIRLDTAAEVLLEVTATCTDCSWSRPGREGAVLRVTVDGSVSQHVVVSRGGDQEPYRSTLGALGPGEHQVAVFAAGVARGASAGALRVSRLAAVVSPPRRPEYQALAHSPFLHARPGTVARFSDIPLLMWYSVEPSPRGTWIRYSVVFSNEDGGTPADRLVATWGRLTDIEYIYGVELDAGARVLAAEYQGPDHKYLPFAGTRVGDHPLLYVVTENNMVSDRGPATERFALAPIGFDIVAGGSRERVMDANPWLYRISSEEAIREGRVDPSARPGTGKLPDPRRFVYVEACGRGEHAAVAFDAGFADEVGAVTWAASDGGLPEFRIGLADDRRQGTERPDGCFRTAVAGPVDASRLAALRWHAYARPPREGEPPVDPSRVRARITRISRVFRLDEEFRPGPNLFSSRDEVELPIGGAPVEIPIMMSRRRE